MKSPLNKTNPKLLNDVNPPPQPWSLSFWPCNSICFVVALALVWLQTDQRKMGSWLTCSQKKLCAGEIWGGSQKDCLFQERKKEEKLTPVTQKSVLFLVDQGMVGASWRTPHVLHAGRITCLVSDTTNECFCLTAILCANSFSDFFSLLGPQILFLITVLSNCAI